MDRCRECARLWRAYKFGLTLRCRLDRKLMEALNSMDLPKFEGLSAELTQVDAAIQFLQLQTEDHEAMTGHKPMQPIGAG